MKVILTEEQLKLISLIKENTDFGEKMKEAIMGTISRTNKLYNIVTFTTIAEIRDGETDISVIAQKFEQLDDLNNNLRSKLYDFEQKNITQDGEWPNPVMEKTYKDLDMRLDKLNPKIDALGLLINALEPISKLDGYGSQRDVDMHGPFSDITATDI